MNIFSRLVTLSLGLGLIAGCLPKQRIVWSPTGLRAAVLSQRGLFFINESGRVLPPRLSGHVEACDWFADGRRVIVAHSTKAAGWDDIAAVLTEEQRAKIKAIAEEVRPRMLAHEGDWDDFEMMPQEQNKMPTHLELAVAIFVRDRLAEGLREKLGEDWEELQRLEMDISHLEVFVVEDTTLRSERRLVNSIKTIDRPSVSPDGSLAAFLMSPLLDDEGGPALHVIEIRGGSTRQVASGASLDYDWSVDGRSLAFIRSSSAAGGDDDQLQLGTLTTVTVADSDGRLLEEWTERKDRAGLVFDRAMGVRWLKDGRLLFSSIEVRLPATTRDMPQRWSLFVIDPKMPTTVYRALGHDFTGPLDMCIPMFAVSPDETRVLLPGPNGRVMLYEFASGEATELVAKGDDKTRAMASWRDNSEICLIVPGSVEKDERKAAQVALWKNGKTTAMSGDWPDEMKEGWLIGD